MACYGEEVTSQGLWIKTKHIHHYIIILSIYISPLFTVKAKKRKTMCMQKQRGKKKLEEYSAKGRKRYAVENVAARRQKQECEIRKESIKGAAS